MCVQKCFTIKKNKVYNVQIYRQYTDYEDKHHFTQKEMLRKTSEFSTKLKYSVFYIECKMILKNKVKFEATVKFLYLFVKDDFKSFSNICSNLK